MEQPFLYVVLHPPTTVVTATSSDHKAQMDIFNHHSSAIFLLITSLKA